MTDTPERIALRWEPGAAVTSGPLMEHPEYTRWVREDVAEAAVAAAVQAERARCAAMFHDEQVRIWSEEILGNLGVEGVLDLTNYEAKLDAIYAVKRGLGLIAAAIRAGGA